MKIFKVFLLSSLFLAVFSVSASAEAPQQNEDFFKEFTEIIPNGVIDAENPEEVLSEIGMDSLLSEIISAISENQSKGISFFFILLGVAVFFALSETSPTDSLAFARQISGGVAAVSSLIIFSAIRPVVENVAGSLRELSLFFSSLMPVITGITLAGGGVNSASVQAFNMNLTLSVVGKVASSLLIPLSMSLFSLALLSAFDSGGISAVSKNIKGFFMWSLGIGCTVVIGVVSMQSMIASASDTAYLRAAKYAASGMIPIVGSTVSSALATLAGGLSYIRSAVGVSAVTVIVVMSMSPLVALLIYRLAFSLCLSVLEFMGSSGGVRVFSAFRTAFDTIISIYVISVVVYITEIVIFMKCGVEVFG